MRSHSLILLVWLTLVPPKTALAQTPGRIDLMTFTLPPGEWKAEPGSGFTVFVRPVPGRGVCRLTVFNATVAGSDLAQDAAIDWDAYVQKRYPTAANRHTRTAKVSGTAWAFIQQNAVAKLEGVDLLLSVHSFTGHGQHMSVLFENSHPPFDALLNQFIGTVGLGEPGGVAKSAPSAEVPSGKPTSLLGKWQRAASSFSNYGSGSVQGTTVWMYDFKPDGTFTFVSKTWPQGGMEMFFHRESGTYLLDGDSFMLTPRQSVSERWTKKPGHLGERGQLVSSQPNAPEADRYRFTFHYSSGIKEWNLILMAEKPTAREGKFDTNTLFPNGWYFKQVAADASLD